jgi:alkanesulfonate monooxygenase SsuD/methylene tetrahydromethanopterin reductase-like flavin-dependent oxidoreductase (luciferase family)
MAINMLRLRTGRPGLFPDPEEAERQELGPMEEEFITSWTANVVHGTADEVRSGLDDLHKRTGADELMITTHAHRGELRLRSYELIADAYGLPAA